MPITYFKFLVKNYLLSTDWRMGNKHKIHINSPYKSLLMYLKNNMKNLLWKTILSSVATVHVFSQRDFKFFSC